MKARGTTDNITLLEKILLLLIGLVGVYFFSNIITCQLKMYDQTRMHRPYTYKIGNEEDVEYLTIEKIGKYRYAYYFHPTPYNPKTDYFITSDSIDRLYPPIELTYLANQENEIFVWTYDRYHVYVDTIVSSNYKLTPEPDLFKNDPLQTMSRNDEYFKETARQREWRDSMFNLPKKYWVSKHDFNEIVYKLPTENTFQEAAVVSKGR